MKRRLVAWQQRGKANTANHTTQTTKSLTSRPQDATVRTEDSKLTRRYGIGRIVSSGTLIVFSCTWFVVVFVMLYVNCELITLPVLSKPTF